MNSIDQGPLPLRERKKAQTAAAIYDAAIALFKEAPYEAVSVDDICDRAGIGRATFFRFYGTKAGLLVEFHRRLTEKTELAVATAGGNSASERLYTVQQTIADAWEHSGQGLRAMATELASSGLPSGGRELHGEMARLVGDIVNEGVASGEFVDRGLAPVFIGWVLISALAGCVVGSIQRQQDDSLSGLTRAALDMLLAGCRPDRGLRPLTSQPHPRAVEARLRDTAGR